MGRTYQTVSFGTARCIGIVRTMAIFEHLICLMIYVVRCFGIVRTISTSSSSCSLVRCLSHSRTTLSFCDFPLHCGLAITVVSRLQRYNCIWLTYIVNVERNILFYIEVWSCEILSLCGKLIWRWNVVFWLRLVFRRRLYRKPFMNHFVL